MPRKEKVRKDFTINGFRVPTFFLSWNSLTFPVFLAFFPAFFPRLKYSNYNYLKLQMRLHKTAWRQLKCIKMLCLSPIFTNNEHVFPNVKLIFNKTMSGNNCFRFTPQNKLILLFSDLIFPDWQIIPWLSSKILWFFSDWKNFSHFSSASGNPVDLFPGKPNVVNNGNYYNQSINN